MVIMVMASLCTIAIIISPQHDDDGDHDDDDDDDDYDDGYDDADDGVVTSS